MVRISALQGNQLLELGNYNGTMGQARSNESLQLNNTITATEQSGY